MEQFIKGEFDAQDKLNKNFKEIETSLSEKVKQVDLNTTNANLAQLSNPNLLINGDFQVWQRGTSFVVSNGQGTYTADRYLLVNEYNVTCNCTITKECSGGIRICFDKDVSNSSNLRYNWDMTELRKLVGKTLTFSTEYKNEYGGIFETPIIIFASGGNVNIATIKTSSTALSNGYTKRVHTFTITSIDDSVTACHFQLYRAANASLFGYHIIKYVKLEAGSISTPFVSKSYTEEYLDCLRYYNSMPYTAQGSKCVNWAGEVVSGNTYLANMKFPVEMRITPTMTSNVYWSDKFSTTAGLVEATPFGFVESRIATATGIGRFITGWIADAEIH
ncbi:hypothetical protein [Clostridium sp. C2-6-12]|uniref:hypothetical protein n=1 Tax=Clostridium sp. C2-6-12 TaxID=2698832 RepID=UPI0013694105|nr:hypothetical protein [Clostridium sp. C2-6-12]